jgi:hypothetical protein
LIGITPAVVAQDNWEGTGEIEEAQIIIQKDRDIVLPNATRIFERVPAIVQPSGMLGLNYSFLPIRFTPSVLNTRVRPLTIQTEPLPAIKNNNVKLGYGNYKTPFFEANFGNGRNDEYLYNLFLHHRSSAEGPVDGKNSGDSQSIVDFKGNVFLNKATLTGEVKYQRDGFTFYGYDPSIEPVKDDIKQTLNQVTVIGRIDNNLPESSAKYSLDGIFEFVQDSYSASEADFGLNLFGRVPVKENYNLDIISDFYLINRKDTLLPSFNRMFFRIKPYVNFTQDNLEIDFGVSTVIEDDTLGESKKFHFFPYLNVSYDLSNNAKAYAGYRGDVDKKSLKGNLKINRYLAPNVDIFNTVRNFDFYAGLKGSFAANWSYDVGAEITYYKNKGYFINSPGDSTRFDIVYDTGTGNSNHLYASLGYNLNDKVFLGLQEHHYFYNTDLIEEAWHLPKNRLNFISTFNFGQKIKLNADAYLLSGIVAQRPSISSAITLESIVDIDIGLEYLISKQASVFINGYNIIGNEYERFLNYPSRGLQIIAGLSYSF